MDTSEIIEKDHPIREKYHKEFENNGFDNIGLKTKIIPMLKKVTFKLSQIKYKGQSIGDDI